MPADAQDHFVVRKDIFDNCLVLYSMEDWERQVMKFRTRLNPYNREHNKLLRNFYMGTAELTLDNNNRLLVPKRLMDLIGAERDVFLAGQDGRIEIWAAGAYAGAAMPPDEFADLIQKVLGENTNEPGI
jgi:MraZ protein